MFFHIQRNFVKIETDWALMARRNLRRRRQQQRSIEQLNAIGDEQFSASSPPFSPRSLTVQSPRALSDYHQDW